MQKDLMEIQRWWDCSILVQLCPNYARELLQLR
jgi:hypothetical protein